MVIYLVSKFKCLKLFIELFNNVILLILVCLTQQNRLLFLPVALLESSDSLLFYQVTIDIWTPRLKNLQELKRVHNFGTWNPSVKHIT